MFLCYHSFLIHNLQSSVLLQGSARTSGTTPIPATPDRMWWRTTSPSSTASGSESAPWCNKVSRRAGSHSVKNNAVTPPLVSVRTASYHFLSPPLTSSVISILRLLHKTFTCQEQLRSSVLHDGESLLSPTRCFFKKKKRWVWGCRGEGGYMPDTCQRLSA